MEPSTMPVKQAFSYEDYLSPFTWRYGSPAMRRIWSEAQKRRTWRRVWVALATAQSEAGLVTPEQVADLRTHQELVDIVRAAEIEAEIRHDLMAEIRTYAEQCPIGGGIIHLGATSADIEDNADILRMREGLALLLTRLSELLYGFSVQIERWAEAPTIAFTHLQPAEPTTTGYRLAQYAQDLLDDWRTLQTVYHGIRGKGFKGAVGTSASYAQLLQGTGTTPAALERRVMSALELEPVPVAGQTYPRKQDFRVLSALAGLGGSLYKFAFDVRLLQSPQAGEWSEPFDPGQVGSSAMPFKRNPVNAENVDSLGRLLAAFPRVAWDNAAHSLLERTLDDSANRRSMLPEAFLAADEMILRCTKLIRNLQVNQVASDRLLTLYGPFAATERLLMETVKRGGNRQEIHEAIRQNAMRAWQELQDGQGMDPAPLLARLLCEDVRITRWATLDDIEQWLKARDYVGDSPQRARAMVAILRQALEHPAG